MDSVERPPKFCFLNKMVKVVQAVLRSCNVSTTTTTTTRTTQTTTTTPIKTTAARQQQ
jgi:hypothetical protein